MNRKIVCDDGIDEQYVHDSAIHTFFAHPHTVAQTIDAIARDPGRPSLFPSQFARDHKQGDRQKKPVKQTAYGNKPLILHISLPFSLLQCRFPYRVRSLNGQVNSPHRYYTNISISVLPDGNAVLRRQVVQKCPASLQYISPRGKYAKLLSF